MKKNITINLFGVLYAIDEDAYELLRKYEENMRAYFRTKDGGDEVADDIECRVAELLSELKASGVEAVSIEHIEEIIRRIGNPEEMDDTGGDEACATAGQAAGTTDDGTGGTGNGPGGAELLERIRIWMSKRRLYRDPDDIIVGGVMSGLCKYFGGTDPLPWRIGMVLLGLLSLSTFAIIYLILWAIVPQARTADERLRMQGRLVTPQTVSEELMHPSGKQDSRPRAARRPTSGQGFLPRLLSLFFFCLRIVVCLGLCAFFFGLLCFMALVLYATIYGVAEMVSADIISRQDMELIGLIPGFGWKLWTLGLSGFVLIGIPLVVLLRRIFSNPEQPSASPVRRFTLVAVWLCALCVGLVMAIFLGMGLAKATTEHDIRRNTVNGIYMRAWSREILAENGWKLHAFDNCNPSGELYETHEFVPGERWRVMTVRTGTAGKPTQFRVERTVDIPAGKYCLEALMKADGNGCCLYVMPDSASVPAVVAEAPAGMGLDGNIRHMTFAESRNTACFAAVADSATWGDVQNNALHWNYVQTAAFTHAGGRLRYGISNDMKFTSRPWEGTRFKVAAIQLRRIGEP